MVIHVPPAMLPSWGLTSDPEAVPAENKPAPSGWGEMQISKILYSGWDTDLRAAFLWSHPSSQFSFSGIQINDVSHLFLPPHLSPPFTAPFREVLMPLGFGEPSYSLSLLPSSRIKDDKPHFIPSSLKEMCLLTSVHPTKMKAACKIYPFLAPWQPVQIFPSEVLRKDPGLENSSCFTMLQHL